MSERAIEAALVKAVRSLAINRHSRLAENARLIPNGGSCDLCNGEWEEGQAENHAPDCLARPNLGAALAAAQRARPFYECPECGADLAIATHAYGCNRPAAQRVAGEDGNRAALQQLVGAWEALPVGHYSPNSIERWLRQHMKPAIDVGRVALALSPGKVEGWREERERCRGIVMARAALWNEHAKVGHEGDCSMSLAEECEDIAEAIRKLPSPPISSRAEDSCDQKRHV